MDVLFNWRKKKKLIIECYIRWKYKLLWNLWLELCWGECFVYLEGKYLININIICGGV